MMTIPVFFIEVAITLVLTLLLVRYIQPFLHKILIDLCGTEDRAQFWGAFSNILLVGMPLIFSLNFRPQANQTEELFFEVASKLSGNLGGFLVALIGLGFVVSFFALVSRRPTGT